MKRNRYIWKIFLRFNQRIWNWNNYLKILVNGRESIGHEAWAKKTGWFYSRKIKKKTLIFPSWSHSRIGLISPWYCSTTGALPPLDKEKQRWNKPQIFGWIWGTESSTIIINLTDCLVQSTVGKLGKSTDHLEDRDDPIV